MAEKIKGFTIELSLDHLKVDSGLKNVRRSISQMNSEMRSNMSVFDRSERSMQKYGVQLQGLNKKLELQKQVVSQAKKDYDQMVAVHGEGSKSAHEAAVAYNNEVAQLNNLERHIGKVTKEMQAFSREQTIQSSLAWKTGDAFESFGNQLESISNRAKSLGGNLTKHLTLPITGLMATVGGFGFKRAMDLEQVEFMMRHISDSTGEFEKRMESVVDLVTDTRFGTAEIGNEFAKLIGAGAGDESARIFNEVAMNLATFKSDDSLIGRFGDLFTNALQSGKIDGTMRNQFANAGVDVLKTLGNLWGKEQDEVAEILREGNLDIEEVLFELSEGVLKGTKGIHGETKEMGGMLEGSGRLLSGQIKNFFAAVSQTGERVIKETGLFDGVKDALDEIRNMLKSGELDVLFTTVFNGVSKALEALVETLRKIFKWFSSLDGRTKEWVGKLVGLSVVIGPIITGFGIFVGILAKVSMSLGAFLKWIAPLTKGLKLAGGAAGATGGKIGVLSKVFTALGGPIGITIAVISALIAGFTIAYKKSETFRDFVHKLGEKLKEVFFGIVDWIKPGYDAVLSFFGEIKEKILAFTNGEGPQFIEAFQNIWNFIKPILDQLWQGIQWVFEQIKWIIVDYVMPVVEFIIKQVWGNIKGIITGALDVIMGAVKIFSGLFTGDFSKMWEGVKQLFFGAIKVVWNWIQLQFIGRILKGVGGLAKGFWGHIKNLWQWVKDAFTNSINVVWTKVSQSFVGRIIANIINFVKNFRQNISNMWTSVKTIFSKWIGNVRSSIANSFVGRIISSITTMKNRFIGIAKDMWSGVKKQFGNIVDGAKALPGRIGKGISGAKDKAISGMKTVGNSLISWAGKPFNKVVDGVNWITGKLGIKTKVGKWDYPQYAKGTKGHPGGPAVVGDKYGRELVKFPDGRTWLSPDTDTLVNLPKGTHVIPNKQTEEILKFDIPHYAKGTGLWGKAKGLASKAVSGLKGAWDKLGDIWDYAKNPSKLLNLVMNKIDVIKDKAQIPTKIVKGGFNYLKSKPLEMIKKAFSEGGGSGKPAFKWPVTSNFGMRVNPVTGVYRLHAGTDFGAPSGAPIPSQTGGTVSFAGGAGGFGNLVKVRQGIWEMYYAHMSKIIARAGQSVKKGDILGLVGSTGNSTGPHLHYETRRNGIPVNPLSLKGFATGGLVKSQMMAMLGEDGEEMVIPLNPNRRTDAMKLLALAAKKIGADGGSFTRPSGMSSNTNGRDEEIDLLRQQVALLTELVLSSKNIEKKPVLSEGDVKRSYDKMDGRESTKHDIFTGRPGGVY